jgi:hypothetical protein
MKARTILSLLLAGAALVGSIVPALAYWQFRWQDPPRSGAVHFSSYFTTEKDCEAAIKSKESELEKKYPNTDAYPLTGSCEEHH